MTERSMLHPDTGFNGEMHAGAGPSEQRSSMPFETSGHAGGRKRHGMGRRVMPVHGILASCVLHIALLVVVLSGGMVPSLVVRPTSAVTVYLTEGSQQRKGPVLSAGAPRKHTPVVPKPVMDREKQDESHRVLTPAVSKVPEASENSEPEAMRTERNSVPVGETVSRGAGPSGESTEAARDDPGNSAGSREGGPYRGEFGAPDGPRFLKRIEPVYPAVARRLGKEGRVLLSLFIDQTGRLVSVDVLEKADYGFERAAVDAVRASTFLPAVRVGKGVPSRSKLAVRFVLYKE